MKFNTGDTVKSLPFGSKEAFVGTIVHTFENYKNQPAYTVRDGFNKRWFREEDELESVN